jgi:hypothetical protein
MPEVLLVLIFFLAENAEPHPVECYRSGLFEDM